MAMIDNRYSWKETDGVLTVHRLKGERASRVGRALLIGYSFVVVPVLLGALVAAALALFGQIPLGFLVHAVFAGMLAILPWVAVREEARRPYQITISERGVETLSLRGRIQYEHSDIDRLRAHRYTTHTAERGESSKLVADLTDGRTVLSIDALQSNACEEMQPIIECYERITRAAAQD